MKILLFNENTSIPGGTDRVFEIEKHALIKKGIHAEVITFNNKEIANFNLPYKINMFCSSIRGTFMKKKFQEQINNYKPDIIHFHNVYQLFRRPVWDCIDKEREKLILHLHNFYPFCLNSFFHDGKELCTSCYDRNSWTPGILKKCYRKSLLLSLYVSLGRVRPKEWVKKLNKISMLIAVSNFAAQFYKSLGVPEEKIIVLANPVCIKDKTLPDISTKRRDYILYLGNIKIEKGIEIFCMSAERNPDLRFIAAGEGEEFRNIQSRYKHLSNIEFRGYVSGDVREDLLFNARFAAIPSLCMETFNLVILEAYSNGTPVLSTGTGGMAEIIAEGITGRIISEKYFPEKVKMFWDEVGRDYARYSRNCIEFAEKYSTETHADNLTSIYRELMMS
jgi:glycosyltransferase involved in cell wall biosynthesis